MKIIELINNIATQGIYIYIYIYLINNIITHNNTII